MTAPAYTTDLATISLAENDSASWAESSNAAWDDGTDPVDEQDYLIQGSYCVSQPLKTGIGTSIFNYGSGITWTSGDVFLAWLYCIGPTALADYSAGGMRMVCGSSIGDFYSWDVLGADYYEYGGWVCIPVDPEVTADDTVGTPGTFSSMTKQFWGTGMNITGNIGKGNSFGTDAIRYGRAEIKFEYGDATNGYCTIKEGANANDANDISFTADTTTSDATLTNISADEVNKLYPGAPLSGTGIPASTFVLSVASTTSIEMTNNATATNTGVTITSFPANRWGILQKISGGYQFQGLMSLGNSTNAVDFRDSNRNIAIIDAFKVTTGFNKIEINNVSSRVDMTNFNFTAIGDKVGAVGSWEVVDNADVNLDTCVFTDMSTFIFQSNSTVLGSTHRRCGIITQGGATLTDGVIDSCAETHAILATNPSAISGYNFISGGSGHGIRCDTTGTYTWSNTDSGYTGTRGSNLVSSTGSADAMFYNNSGGLITLNISGSGQQPSVRNGAGATTQVNADVNVTFTNMKDNTEVRVYKTSDDSVVDGIENATAGTADARTFTWTAGAGTSVYYILHNWNGTEPFYQTIRVEGYIVPSNDTDILVAQQLDRNAE